MDLHTAKRRKPSSIVEQPSLEGGQSRSLKQWRVSNNQSDERLPRSRNGLLQNPKSICERSKTAPQPNAELALASGLYKSSLFKLQIDELLMELRPDHEKQLSRLAEPLRKLKNIIEGLPDLPPMLRPEAEKELRRRFIGKRNVYWR